MTIAKNDAFLKTGIGFRVKKMSYVIISFYDPPIFKKKDTIPFDFKIYDIGFVCFASKKTRMINKKIMLIIT